MATGNARFLRAPGTRYLTRSFDTEASYEEVAEALGISTARVGQLEASGIARMRRCFSLIEAGVPVDMAVDACKGRGAPGLVSLDARRKGVM